MKTILIFAVLSLMAGCAPPAPQIAFEPQPRSVLSDMAHNSAGPQMFFTPSGHLYLLAGTKVGRHTALNVYVSKDGGDSFDERIPVAPPTADAMTMGEMSPVMVEDPAGPSMDVLYEGGDGKLYFSRAYMFAHKFPRAIDLVPKKVPSQNGFATMSLSPTGTIYVAWLDGRSSDHNPPNTFSLYVTRSTDHGKTFQTPVKVDGSTCPCCRPAFAFASDGTAYVAWRKDFPGNYRDIVVASSHDGSSWSAPIRVAQDGWSLLGCPDSGPTLKVVEKRLYIAWYTQGSKNVPEVRSAYTDDGARTFSTPQTISANILDANHPKFVQGASDASLVFEGRTPGKGGWAPLTAFITTLSGNQATKAVAMPAGSASLSDPIAVQRDAQTIYVAGTGQSGMDSQVVVTRGRAQ
jgi:hypothetical protein